MLTAHTPTFWQHAECGGIGDPPGRRAMAAGLSVVATFATGAVPTLELSRRPPPPPASTVGCRFPGPPTWPAMEPQGGAALNAQPAWVVGLASATAEGKRVPLIGHWVNGAWVKTAAPWTTYGVLNAVVATSDTNAWTVGDIGTYTRWPIVGRWNGTAWRSVAVPRPARQLAVFADMANTDDVRFWAVGEHLVNGRAKPLAMLTTAPAGRPGTRRWTPRPRPVHGRDHSAQHRHSLAGRMEDQRQRAGAGVGVAAG